MSFSTLKQDDTDNFDNFSDKKKIKIKRQVEELLKKKRNGDKLDENQLNKLKKYAWIYEKKDDIKEKYYTTNPNRKTKRQIKKEKNDEYIKKKKVKEKKRKEKERKRRKKENERQENKRIKEEEEENKKIKEEEEEQRREKERREKERRMEISSNEIYESFKILELDYTTDIRIIKKKFHKLSLIYHPDKGGDKVICQNINNAYTLLTDMFKN